MTPRILYRGPELEAFLNKLENVEVQDGSLFTLNFRFLLNGEARSTTTQVMLLPPLDHQLAQEVVEVMASERGGSGAIHSWLMGLHSQHLITKLFVSAQSMSYCTEQKYFLNALRSFAEHSRWTRAKVNVVSKGFVRD